MRIGIFGSGYKRLPLASPSFVLLAYQNNVKSLRKQSVTFFIVCLSGFIVGEILFYILNKLEQRKLLSFENGRVQANSFFPPRMSLSNLPGFDLQDPNTSNNTNRNNNEIPSTSPASRTNTASYIDVANLSLSLFAKYEVADKPRTYRL